MRPLAEGGFRDVGPGDDMLSGFVREVRAFHGLAGPDVAVRPVWSGRMFRYGGVEAMPGGFGPPSPRWMLAGTTMSAALEFAIADRGPISREVLRHRFDRFALLAEHVRELPYGWPVNGDQPLAVLTERRGTCSSKHRLLATVAHECGRTDIDLVVGIYSMSEENTPGVGAVLEPAGVVSIPEAHCYLRRASRRYDFTGLSSGSSSPFDALLSEHVVLPARLRADKAELHREAMRKWSAFHGMAFADAWSLREACIEALASAGAPGPTS